MPLRPALLAEIRATLGAAVAPNLTTASAGCDLFEAYIWSIIIEAARNEGAAVSYENSDCSIPGIFTFRTGPGRIYMSTPSSPVYTHAVLAFPDKRVVEAHLGIYVSGYSQVQHECDTAVLLRDEATRCRQEKRNPRHTKLIIATECKFYSTNLGVDLARSFFGLITDVRGGDRRFVSNWTSAPVQQFFGRRAELDLEVSPSNARQVAGLRGAFERTFRSFKAQRTTDA